MITLFFLIRHKERIKKYTQTITHCKGSSILIKFEQNVCSVEHKINNLNI